MASNPNRGFFRRRSQTVSISTTGTIVRVGIGSSPWADVYHGLLRMTWRRFFALIAVVYLLINAIFAFGFWQVGGIENWDGSLLEAFFFSVQTFGTIGYGKMDPVTLPADLLMTAESMTSVVSTALVTGLIFAKFARPTARVMWSRVAVLTRRDGLPVLMVRMANERSNQIVDANLKLTVLMDETTKEGERLRRLHDLPLLRSNTPMFSLTFTAISPITPGSPFYGMTREEMGRRNAQIVGSLIGLDDAMNATVHSRHTWNFEDVRWNMKFVDILSSLRDGARMVDYTRFHDAEEDNLPGFAALGPDDLPATPG